MMIIDPSCVNYYVAEYKYEFYVFKDQAYMGNEQLPILVFIKSKTSSKVKESSLKYSEATRM